MPPIVLARSTREDRCSTMAISVLPVFMRPKYFTPLKEERYLPRDPDLLKKMAYMRNFGHDGPDRFADLGINGKNSEFHAAMGLAVLPYIGDLIQRRKEQSENYNFLLCDQKIGRQHIIKDTLYNYAYYSILLDTESSLLVVKRILEENNIMTRRYFYPSLNGLSYVRSLPVQICSNVSRRILCLPLYHDLQYHEQQEIISILLTNLPLNKKSIPWKNQ
jgi:dTDP-4-amino-4,6-dideoxygalactose transaminase